MPFDWNYENGCSWSSSISFISRQQNNSRDSSDITIRGNMTTGVRLVTGSVAHQPDTFRYFTHVVN